MPHDLEDISKGTGGEEEREEEIGEGGGGESLYLVEVDKNPTDLRALPLPF